MLNVQISIYVNLKKGEKHDQITIGKLKQYKKVMKGNKSFSKLDSLDL